MELIVISEDKTLSKTLVCSIDSCLDKYKMKKIELYSMNVILPNETDKFNQLKPYFFLVDIRNMDNFVLYCEGLVMKFIYCYMGIITNTDNKLAMLINRVPSVQGCINLSYKLWEGELFYMLQKIENQYLEFRNALTVSICGIDNIIPFEDIYFIETIKATHYLVVYHKDKTTKIRSNISDLIYRLDNRFEIVKASTIVNILNVIVVDKKTKKLIFSNDRCCYYSEKYYSAFHNKLIKV